MKQFSKSTSAVALVAVLLFVAVMSFIAANALHTVESHFRTTNQIISWQESILAAEAGADLAIRELRNGANGNLAEAWEGWSSKIDGAPEENIDPSLNPVYLTTPPLTRTYSNGGKVSWARVSVDAPAQLRDSSGEQWYRVRSTGYSQVPGGTVVSQSAEETRLRKLSFRVDRLTQKEIAEPQASRSIELIVKPVSAFSNALISDGGIDMNNHNIVVDSYDSRDPDKSTNGIYDPTKRQENGDIATNGQLIDAGNAHIHGDASTNAGTVLNGDNVSGDIKDDFYQELPLVRRPTDFAPDGIHSGALRSSLEIQAKPDKPSRFLFDTIALSGSDKLVIKGADDGSDTFVEIVVESDVSLKGLSQIVLGPGVYARFFLEGNADFGGQGILNPGQPLNLQLYGCLGPFEDESDPPETSITIAGNGGFSGSVYAPLAEISMVGGGTTDSIFGAFAGKTIRMTGVQSVHYDEALRDGGLVSDYKIASWFEDMR